MSQASLWGTCLLLAGTLMWFARTASGTRWVFSIALVAGLGFHFAPDRAMQAIEIVCWGIAIVLGVSLWARARTGRRLGAVATAVLLGTGLADFVRHRETWPRDSGHPLVTSYPFESMAPRLAYESHRQVALPEVRLSEEVLKEMDRKDPGRHRNLREAFLYRLHDANSRRFRDARGFGWTRMGELVPEALNLPPVPDPLPLEIPASTHYEPVADADDRPSPEALRTKHFESRDDFLEAGLNGYIRDREQVAGFVPHAFRPWDRARFDKPAISSKSGPSWTLTRLQLVSLLRFDEPRIYETNEFPDMARLVHIPTRPATQFEREAIPRLVAREDVVIDDDPRSLRMVGSLRALESCCRCHDVPKGTLLGAFSYIFSRSPQETGGVRESHRALQ